MSVSPSTGEPASPSPAPPPPLAGDGHDVVAHDATFDELRPATLYEILRLRSEVFIVEQDCAFGDLDGRDREPNCRHLWLEQDGAVVGYSRILPDPAGPTQIGRVVTSIDARNQRLGVRLMHESLARIEGPVLIKAQARLAGWYGQFGFVAEGDEYEWDGIAHQRMRLTDRSNLVTRRVPSPHAAPAPPTPTDDDPYRVDPLTRELAYIVAARQARPNLPSEGCPFCPGGLEAPEPYDVRWFPNRWPAIPDGRCEIVLYTSDHDATFASLGSEGARRVVDLWAERTAALGARDDVDYVLVFENRGPEVGATIAHPHGQIYAFDAVPPRALSELEAGDAAAGLGPDAPGDRVVAHHGAWRAWVPWAATWPFALMVAPESPEPDLPSLDDRSRDDLAAVLVDVTGRLDRLFDQPMPYMLWFHQRPTDGGDWPDAWLHAHIAPLYRSPGTQRFVAAGELGSQVFFNPVDPVDAAAALRDA